MSDTKQRKPWYRPRNVFPPVLAAVLTIVGWLTYLVYWALTVEPNPSVDYAIQMQALSIDNQPKGDNGWPLLMDAISILEKIEESLHEGDESIGYFSYFDFDIIYEGDADQSEVAKLHITLEQLRSEDVFDLLAQAAVCSNIVGPPRRSDTGPLLSMLLPETRLIRMLAYARIASLYLAVLDRDSAETVHALDETLLLARALTYQPLLVEQLIGQHIAVEVSTRLRDAISHKDCDQQTLSHLIDSYRRHLPLGSLTIGVESERLLFHDTIQNLFSDNGRGNGRLLFSQLDDVGIMNIGDISDMSWSPFGGRESFPAIANVAGIAFADRKETVGVIDRYFDAFIRQATMSREQRLADPFDDSEFRQLNWRHPIPKLLLPAITKAIDERDGVECQIAGTILMLSIEQYRASSGHYPGSLIDLIPAILDELPRDPYSAEGFIYRKVSENLESAGYLLYSVGADGVDNGATMSAEDPSDAFTADSSDGLDYVFNKPRPDER